MTILARETLVTVLLDELLGKKSLAVVLGTYYRYREMYYNVKLLHPRHGGFATGVPDYRVKEFSFADPGTTTDNLNEIVGAMAIEVVNLREGIRILRQKKAALESIQDHGVDAIHAHV